MAEAISENRQIKGLVRRLKGKNKWLPSSIDNVAGDEELLDIDDMSITNAEIKKQIKNNVACDVSFDEVIEGVQHLKLGKSNGEFWPRQTWSKNTLNAVYKHLFIITIS